VASVVFNDRPICSGVACAAMRLMARCSITGVWQRPVSVASSTANRSATPSASNRRFTSSVTAARYRSTTASTALLCFLIKMGGTVAFYTYSVNAPAIVKSAYESEAMTATWINLIGLIFLMALQPAGGLISDRVGRRPLLLWFGVGGLFYTYVLITYLPETRSPITTFALVAVGYVILTGYTSINALVKSELFPEHVRALGAGVGYALANSMFGGTAPVIYQALKARDEVPLFIAYVTACIAVSLVVYVFFLKNKGETYLDREQGSAFPLTSRTSQR